MVLNWLLRWVLVGPLVRLFFRIKVVGMENLPRRGPYVLAIGPHRTELESIIVATYLRRHQLHFFAKQEYWEKHPRLGKLMTAIGLIPLPRQARRALVEQIERGVEVLKNKHVLAIYPEATRGFDEYMHRGYPGGMRISLRAGGVPIVPVGLRGMRELNPPYKGFRLGKGLVPGRGEIHIGEPIYPLLWFDNPEKHQMAEKVLERVLTKPLTTKVSHEIASLAGLEYLDELLAVPDAT